MNKWPLNVEFISNPQSIYMQAYNRKICKKRCFFANKIIDLQQRFLNMSLKLELSQ